MTESDRELRNERVAGSPDMGEPVFLAVGKLRRPHGVRGEMLMDVLTDFPDRLQVGKPVFIGEKRIPLLIRGRRTHHKGMLISFEGYDDPESIGVYRNAIAYVRIEDLPPLPDGEFYHHQILGIRVVTEEGRVLGHLSKILETGANDVYVVGTLSGPDILLPAIESVIRSIDLEKNEMLVYLLPGLEGEQPDL